MTFEQNLLKGDTGEAIVYDYLISRGLVPYKPIFDGAHPFDFLCSTRDKRNLVIVDAKTKARMNKKYNGRYVTGINEKSYKEYAFVSNKYHIPFWLIFIDELEGRIYGNTLEMLKGNSFVKKYNVSIRFFLLDDMKHISELADSQCELLRTQSNRSYRYV